MERDSQKPDRGRKGGQTRLSPSPSLNYRVSEGHHDVFEAPEAAEEAQDSEGPHGPGERDRETERETETEREREGGGEGGRE